MAISLGIKLILLSLRYQSAVNMDGTLYITAAMHFAEGDWTSGLMIYNRPAYSLLLALTHTIIPDWLGAAYFISIASMVIATIPLYLLTKELFGIKAAFWACMIFAILPKINEWSFYVSRDAVFLAIAAWFVYIALKSYKNNKLFLFGNVFFIAWASILFRTEGILLLIFYTILLIHQAMTTPDHKGHHYIKLLIWIGVPLCAGMIIVATMGIKSFEVNRFYQIYQWVRGLFNGEFLSSYHTIYNFLSEAEKHPPFSGYHYSFAAISRHYLLVIYMLGIIEAMLKIISPLSCIPLFIALKHRAPFQGKRILMLCAMFIAFVYYSLILRDFIATRFLLIPGFFLLPWVGAGLKQLWDNAVKPPHLLRTKILLILVPLVPMVMTLGLVRNNDNTLSKAISWLTKNNTVQKVIIATNATRAPFYVALETEQNPDWTVCLYTKENLKEIESFAMKRNATFLILKEKHRKPKEKPILINFEHLTDFVTKYEITTLYTRRRNEP